MTITTVQIQREGRWHHLDAGLSNTRTRCRRKFDLKENSTRVIEADDANAQINWCRECDSKTATPERARRRIEFQMAKDRPPEFSRDAILADVSRAVLAAFPERGERIMREVERRLI